MCDEQHYCECFYAGAENLADSFMVWATGAHGDACRCSTCDMALLMMANGMPRLSQMIRINLRDAQAPPPSDQMDASNGQDF